LGGPKSIYGIFTGGWSTLIGYGIAEWNNIQQALSRCIFGTIFVAAWAVVVLMMASLFFCYYVTGAPINF